MKNLFENIAICILVICLFSVVTRAEEAAPACADAGKYIEVQLKVRVLSLCDDSKVVNTYAVSLGRGGIGKRVDGDKKTPVGTYVLGEPFVSKKFHLFIPVGYPTTDQADAGYTGDSIGVHGPFHYFSWLRRLNTWVNWTTGCVALGRNSDIEEIVGWVKAQQVQTIKLR
jgi:murein L,D-transpeptidase YafK